MFFYIYILTIIYGHVFQNMNNFKNENNKKMARICTYICACNTVISKVSIIL